MKNKAHKRSGNFIVIMSPSTMEHRNRVNDYPTFRYNLHYHWRDVFGCNNKGEFLKFLNDNGYDISKLHHTFYTRNVCDYTVDKNGQPARDGDLLGRKDHIAMAYFDGFVKRNVKK